MASPPPEPLNIRQRVYTESDLRELRDAELLDLVRETITQLDLISDRLKSQVHDDKDYSSNKEDPQGKRQ